MENRDMNLFDFIRMCWHALMRFFKKVGVVILETIRLCIQYIWIVVPCAVIGLVGGWLWSKEWATTYHGNATIVYAEGMRDVVKDELIGFVTLESDVKRTEFGLDKEYQKALGKMERLNVIDTYHFDSLPDFIDRKKIVEVTDTMNRIMKDRLHLVVDLKGRKDFEPLQSALEKYFNEKPNVVAADERCKSIRNSRLEHFRNEYARLDSFATYDYFLRPRYLGAEWGNHIISERDQELYYEDLMFVQRQKEYLENQVIETPRVINFQTPFIVYACPAILKYAVGLVIGGLLGIAIALLVKYWGDVVNYMKKR